MQNENNSYRIRTEVGVDSPNVVNVKLNQTFEFLNILSLKIGQENFYKMPSAPYGVVAGRVLLGGKSFGIENAKVSIFIPKDNAVFEVKDNTLYAYSSVNSTNYDGVRYNLLPSYVDEVCHQNVGTMFEKEYVLDNNDVIRIFDKYYTYTTRTNNAGDYFIYGVPVGQQTLHVDVDLSDIGALSVRPHDMIGQGYDIGQFESPNKFKAGKNLNILPQIKSHDRAIHVYPFWGDTTEDENNAVITRADIEIDYKFEPSAVFIGSIISDKGSNSISHKCVPDDKNGLMSDMITGEGKIEMIRKTFDGRVEQFSVKGNRLIDGDGVWCYQVPMNLDYVVMDEFGNLVPTDNPEKGIPTRARVRFRISMDESPMDDTARKRARFLVPNNPRLTDDYPDFQKTHEADYEFGTFTKEESYRDMFWNNVYTVKSYIPRLQKRVTARTKKFTGVKMVNHSGDNNPMPYNNLSIKMGFVYRFLCTMLTMFLWTVTFINTSVLIPTSYVLILLGKPFRNLANVFYAIDIIKAAKKIGDFFNNIACFFEEIAVKMVIKIPPGICEEDSPDKTYILGAKNFVKNWVTKVKAICKNCGLDSSVTGNEVTSDIDSLLNCVQNALAQEQQVTSFNFQNDWINGVLYAPLWYRKIRPKKRLLFGLITTIGSDNWCDGGSSKMAKGNIWGLKLYQTCANSEAENGNKIKQIPLVKKKYDEANCYGYQCHNRALSFMKVEKGIIVRKETKTGEYVYYYKSVECDDDVKILFATDLVLLGSLNDCDVNGIPQFFKHLEETTYNMPPDLVSLTWNSDINTNKKKNIDKDNDSDSLDLYPEEIDDNSVHTEYTGADYGNAGWDQWYDTDRVETKYIKNGNNDYDNGGLFYNLNCNFSYVKPKCCINLSRICEFGVSLDQSIELPIENGRENSLIMPPDGFVSYDELYNTDARSMFATMNGNRLREKKDLSTGFPIYDFNYLYPENFDGSMNGLMRAIPATNARHTTIVYRENYKLEQSSESYLRFRYGLESWNKSFIHSYVTYPGLNPFLRTENSFYFYFGLKTGKTAIDKFRNNYYAECTNDEPSTSIIVMDYQPNSWCKDMNEEEADGYVSFDLSRLELPCSISFDNRNYNYAPYDVNVYDIKSYKIYMGHVNLNLENDGYKQLNVDSENRETENGAPIVLRNGYYVVKITDANGEVYKFNLSFEPEKLSFSVEAKSFRLTNEELSDQYSSYDAIASDRTLENGKRKIGGYLRIYNLMNGELPLDNFKLTIEGIDVEDSNDPMGIYSGSEYKKVNGFITWNGVQYISDTNGEYVFGVPKGDKKYKITITQICDMGGQEIEIDNFKECEIIVSQSQPFKMFVNEVDTELLQNFTTGYITDSNGIINRPYVGYSPSAGINPNELNGWIDFRMGSLSVIERNPQESGFPGNYFDISDIVDCLSAPQWNTGGYKHPYTLTEDYIFTEENMVKTLEEYDEIPNPNDPNNDPSHIWPKYIKVATPNDPFIYWIYELNNAAQYNVKTDTNNQPCEDLTLAEYFSMNTETKIEVIDALNDVIERRLELVDRMIDAFWMYENEEENKITTITYQTDETPVKTLVYYIPDESDNVTKQGSTRYQILDMNKEENTITSCLNPSITDYNGKPVFFDYNEGYANSNITPKYKLPPYCAIQNAIPLTVPKAVGSQAINPFAPSYGVRGDMNFMFGFHVIDKRPRTDINVWVPLVDYPIYWPDITTNPQTQPPEGIEEGGFLTMNGCVSGYFFNGFSTSTDCIAKFDVQTIENDISMYTLTTDSAGYPDEFHIPTKRLIYQDANTIPASQDRNYNDFIATNPYNGFEDASNPIPSSPQGLTQYRYISYSPATKYMIVKDTKTTFREDLHPEGRFGLPENSKIPNKEDYYNSNIFSYTTYNIVFPRPVFSSINENVKFTTYFTFDSGITPIKNPIYQRCYDNSSVLSTNTEWNMSYGANIGNETTVIYPTSAYNANPLRVFFVGATEDGKYRGISPTYEISPLSAIVTGNPQKTIFTINFDGTINNINNSYYLQHYPFYIYLYGINNDEIAHSEELTLSPSDTSIVVNFDGIYYFYFPDHPSTVIHSAFVKDVTGIMRPIILNFQ